MPFEGVNYFQASGNSTATLNCSSYSHFQNDNYPNLLKQKNFYNSLSNGYNSNTYYTDFNNSTKPNLPSTLTSKSITSPNLQSNKNSSLSAAHNLSTINNINVNHINLNSSTSSRSNANHLHNSLSSDSSITSNLIKNTNGILLDKDIELKIVNELKNLTKNINKDQRVNLMPNHQQIGKSQKPSQLKDQELSLNNRKIELTGSLTKSPIMTNCKDLNNNTLNNNVDSLSSSSNASLTSLPANPTNVLNNNFLNDLNKNFNGRLNSNLNSNELSKLRKNLQSGDLSGDLLSNCLTNCDLSGLSTSNNSINLAKNPTNSSYNSLNNLNGLDSNSLSASLSYLSNLGMSSTLTRQLISGSFDNLLTNQLDSNLNQMRLNHQSNNTRQMNPSILNDIDNYMNPLNKHLSNKKLDPNKLKKQLPLNKSLSHEMNAPNALDTTMNNLFCEPIKKICRVCGDKASYNNYFVLTCDACKTFFRRSILDQKKLRCHFNNRCQIDVKSRKDCSKCRLSKCLAVGMKQELIGSEEERKKKNGNSNGNGRLLSSSKILQHFNSSGSLPVQNHSAVKHPDQLGNSYLSLSYQQLSSPSNPLCSTFKVPSAPDAFPMNRSAMSLNGHGLNHPPTASISPNFANLNSLDFNNLSPLNNFNMLKPTSHNDSFNQDLKLDATSKYQAISPINRPQSTASTSTSIQSRVQPSFNNSQFKPTLHHLQQDKALLSSDFNNNNNINNLPFGKLSTNNDYFSEQLNGCINALNNIQNTHNLTTSPLSTASSYTNTENNFISPNSSPLKQSPPIINGIDKKPNKLKSNESIYSIENLSKSSSHLDESFSPNDESLNFAIHSTMRKINDNEDKTADSDSEHSLESDEIDIVNDGFSTSSHALNLSDISNSSIESTLTNKSGTRTTFDTEKTIKIETSINLGTLNMLEQKSNLGKIDESKLNTDHILFELKDDNDSYDRLKRKHEINQEEETQNDTDFNQEQFKRQFEFIQKKEGRIQGEIDILDMMEKKEDEEAENENLNDKCESYSLCKSTKKCHIDDGSSSSLSLSYDSSSPISQISKERDISVAKYLCTCDDSTKTVCRILSELLNDFQLFNLTVAWTADDALKLKNLCKATERIIDGELNCPLINQCNTEMKAVKLQSFAVDKFIRAFRHLDKFKSLNIEDQKRLLQPCCAELLLLRSAKHFDSIKEEWKVFNPKNNTEPVKLPLTIMREKNLIAASLHLSYLKFYENVKRRWREGQVISDKKLSYELMVEKLTYSDLCKKYLVSIHFNKDVARSEFKELQVLLRTLTNLKDSFETSMVDSTHTQNTFLEC